MKPEIPQVPPRGNVGDAELRPETAAPASGPSRRATLLLIAGFVAYSGGVAYLVFRFPGSRIELADSASAWSVAWSPDGTRIVTGGDDGRIRVWNPRNGKLIRTLEDREGGVFGVSYLADSRTVVGVGRHPDSVASVWDSSTGQRSARTFPGAEFVVLSPDGRMLLTGDGDEQTHVVRSDTFEKVSSIDNSTNESRTGAFAPDGRTWAVCSWSNVAHLYDTVSGARILPPVPTDHAAQSVAFSPDGRSVAFGHTNSDVTVWDRRTAKRVARLTGMRGEVGRVAYSPDGTLLAACTDLGDFALYDTVTWKLSSPIAKKVGWNIAWNALGTALVAFGPHGVWVYWKEDVDAAWEITEIVRPVAVA